MLVPLELATKVLLLACWTVAGDLERRVCGLVHLAALCHVKDRAKALVAPSEAMMCG